jgi:cation:H+ antiporter
MFASWSTPELLAAFALAAAVVVLSGLRMTGLVDHLADRLRNAGLLQQHRRH